MVVPIRRMLGRAHLYLACAALTNVGCFWPGRMLSRTDIEYQHESIRWVFQCGGQFYYGFRGHLFNPLNLPAPVRNSVLTLQEGGDAWSISGRSKCVVITEGYPGNYGGFSVWAPLTALDLETGKSKFANRSSSRCTCRTWSFEPEVSSQRLVELETGIRMYMGSGLYIGRADDEPDSRIRLLTLLKPPQVFGPIVQVLEFPEEQVVVLEAWDGIVVCIDLKKTGLLRGVAPDDN